VVGVLACRPRALQTRLDRSRGVDSWRLQELSIRLGGLEFPAESSTFVGTHGTTCPSMSGGRNIQNDTQGAARGDATRRYHYFNNLIPSLHGLSGLVVRASDCGLRGPRFESHCKQQCLSRQLLRYTALGTGCAPLLPCRGRLSLPPSVGRQKEYQLIGCVIITKATVDVDGNCQFSADSQPKSTGLV